MAAPSVMAFHAMIPNPLDAMIPNPPDAMIPNSPAVMIGLLPFSEPPASGTGRMAGSGVTTAHSTMATALSTMSTIAVATTATTIAIATFLGIGRSHDGQFSR